MLKNISLLGIVLERNCVWLELITRSWPSGMWIIPSEVRLATSSMTVWFKTTTVVPFLTVLNTLLSLNTTVWFTLSLVTFWAMAEKVALYLLADKTYGSAVALCDQVMLTIVIAALPKHKNWGRVAIVKGTSYPLCMIMGSWVGKRSTFGQSMVRSNWGKITGMLWIGVSTERDRAKDEFKGSRDDGSTRVLDPLWVAIKMSSLGLRNAVSFSLLTTLIRDHV